VEAHALSTPIDDDYLVRRPKVRELTGLSDSSIDRLEKEDRFPKRYQTGDLSVAWSFREIMEWKKTLPRGPLPAPTRAIKASQQIYKTRKRTPRRQRGEG
jgi:predicted DNA-binding transcriptional regulator AlpA